MRPSPALRRALPLALLFAGLVALSGSARATNARLAAAPSAFLRSYADTAVDWLPWDDSTFARAKAEQKPVFLAIGSFTSELSRAMARQSFANAEVAAFLREHYLCVLVDARERPDLVAVYQAYLRATKQLNGLPLNVWLTPELEPIDGSTYIPPTEEWGKEGFFVALKRIAGAWKADPAAQRRQAHDGAANTFAAERLAPSLPAAADFPSILAAATDRARAQFDTAHGGFGDPPRYAEPELLLYLLREKSSRDLALATLRAIVASPLRDPLDGGFFRNAQDTDWRQPYFQKHLADQARLAVVLLEAARLTGYAEFRTAARGALQYALQRLQQPTGGFAAAEDATADQAGAYYFWTRAEIEAVLVDDAPAFSAAYGVTDAGNVPPDAYPGVAAPGRNLLFRAATPGSGDLDRKFAAARALLLARRATRPAPALDDDAPAAVHGLLLTALVQAGDQLQDPAFKQAAAAELVYIRRQFIRPASALLHLPGRASPPTPADYVFVIRGLWAARQAGDPTAGKIATALTHRLRTAFRDETTGRFLAFADSGGAGLWLRPHLVPPTAGELPQADAGLLASHTLHPVAADFVAQLGPQLAAQLRDSGDDRRGDLLLALQSVAP